MAGSKFTSREGPAERFRCSKNSPAIRSRLEANVTPITGQFFTIIKRILWGLIYELSGISEVDNLIVALRDVRYMHETLLFALLVAGSSVGTFRMLYEA